MSWQLQLRLEAMAEIETCTVGAAIKRADGAHSTATQPSMAQREKREESGKREDKNKERGKGGDRQVMNRE